MIKRTRLALRDVTAPRPETAPHAKAERTGKWARTMCKWVISRANRLGRRWEIVNFTGPQGRESRGIVDLLAVRKDHSAQAALRGDFFEMILIQVKGGGAPNPTPEDIERLRRVKAYYNAHDVVLASWKKGAQPALYVLDDNASSSADFKAKWRTASASVVFGPTRS
jgi:hypothetical protein